VLVVGVVRKLEVGKALDSHAYRSFHVHLRASTDDLTINDYDGVVPAIITEDATGWLDQCLAQPIKEPEVNVWVAMACQWVGRRANPASKYLRAVQGAMWTTTNTGIPVNSYAELLMAHKLIHEKRQFNKPLPLDGDLNLPDFQLTDTRTPVSVEVSDPQDAKQAAIKRRKMQTLYPDAAATYNLYYWDAIKHKEPPALPTAPVQPPSPR
jgi:Protein of unknown function (DUF1173)